MTFYTFPNLEMTDYRKDSSKLNNGHVWKRIDVPPLAVMDIYICIQVVRNFICDRTVNNVSLNEQKISLQV